MSEPIQEMAERLVREIRMFGVGDDDADEPLTTNLILDALGCAGLTLRPGIDAGAAFLVRGAEALGDLVVVRRDDIQLIVDGVGDSEAQIDDALDRLEAALGGKAR
jgi:hypothetical protein